MAKTKDLTQGGIYKGLIDFSIPILLGYLFQNLYNSVDSAVVGRYVGKAALGAVSSSSTISNVIVGFFTGLATGVTVILSRSFGAKNYKKLHTAIHTCILFSLISGILMALVGQFISPLLLKAVNCPPDVYDHSIVYLRLYLVGCLFTSVYNVSSSVLRSVGDSRSPFIYLVISSITNIVLDIVFVAYLHMGVSGVACATIISQIVSCTLVYIKLTRTDDVYKLVLHDLKIDMPTLYEVFNIGLPAAMQTCLISLSNVFIQRYVNMFESNAIAGVGAAQKVDAFSSMPSQSIGLAITTFVSQNIGADRHDRVHKGIKAALVISIAAVVIIAVPCYVFAPTLVKLFNDDPGVIGYGVDMCRAILPLYWILSVNSVYAGVNRGYGYSRDVMLMSLICMVGIRQVYLFAFMKIFNSIYVVYYGYPVAWGLSCLANYVFYRIKIKRSPEYK